jgi:hypothetical protein
MTVVDAVFVPLVPFTVTVYCPDVPEQERVEFPDDVNVVTLRAQGRPVLGETVSFNVTVPENATSYVTVIVEVPVAPVTTETVVGLAATVKAIPTMNLTEADRDSPFPVPVTVTLKVPDRAESEHARIELREVVVVLNAKLAGLRTHVSPRVGETVSVNVTVPVKP